MKEFVRRSERSFQSETYSNDVLHKASSAGDLVEELFVEKAFPNISLKVFSSCSLNSQVYKSPRGEFGRRGQRVLLQLWDTAGQER